MVDGVQSEWSGRNPGFFAEALTEAAFQLDHRSEPTMDRRVQEGFVYWIA
jgi:hypothetical protein